MGLTQQRELVEEVSREMALDKAFKILMQRSERISSFNLITIQTCLVGLKSI